MKSDAMSVAKQSNLLRIKDLKASLEVFITIDIKDSAR